MKKYLTKGKVVIERKSRKVDRKLQQKYITEKLNSFKGAYLCSSFEYPGRYTRWDMGFICPPCEIIGIKDSFRINALNNRGKIINDIIFRQIHKKSFIKEINIEDGSIYGKINTANEIFSEEERSKQNSLFSLIREIREVFFSEEDSFFGLYGTFAYDLIYQFEKVELCKLRNYDSRDMVLYVVDEVFVSDHQKAESYLYSYNFEYEELSTKGLQRIGEKLDYEIDINIEPKEIVRGKYAEKVFEAKEFFKRGDLFEVVPSHAIEKKTNMLPSEIFKRLTFINPSPYGFFFNIGNEFLIGSSPEMYVRVEGQKVETCPISGTIKRGKNAIEDHERIRELINSLKDESELTMCTDVDRNDKSRICEPGTVKVIGRRQIEMYSHLIHTVDHVEGILRKGYDSLDAFMTHMWAVTVTGAPKPAAVKWLEKNEETPREWYAGSVGCINFNGNINTGLTLRTIHLKRGLAKIRAGATLLYDSIPELEEEETYTKAAAMIKVVDENISLEVSKKSKITTSVNCLKVLIVDHEDSFVNTLGDYFRQTGSTVNTVRHNYAKEILRNEKFDLVVLSPGPGRPEDFKINETIEILIKNETPIFGVCLGLQGIVEYFGGKLSLLDEPYHGKYSYIKHEKESVLFKGIPEKIKVGRYHSLYASSVSEDLEITALTVEKIVMAVENKGKKIFAVQFHPESIMTLDNNIGLNIIENVINIIMEGKHENT